MNKRVVARIGETNKDCWFSVDGKDLTEFVHEMHILAKAQQRSMLVVELAIPVSNADIFFTSIKR